MQVVVFVDDGTATDLPEHAKVIPITDRGAESARTHLHATVDTVVNDLKAGWTPSTADAQAELKAAEIAAAEAAAVAAGADRRLEDARRNAGVAVATVAPKAKATKRKTGKAKAVKPKANK